MQQIPQSPPTQAGATIVVCADVHLDRPFAWCRPETARRRRHNIRRSLRAVVELAQAVDADALFCAGDLYEDALYTPDCANFVAETFAIDRPVFISPGNHDFYSSSSMYARQAWPSNVTIFREARFVPAELTDGLTVWGAAHEGSQGTPGFFEGFDGVARGGVNVALFHGSEQGAFRFEGQDKAMHAPFTDDGVAQAGFDYAFVGHYHRHRIATHHCYPGNPDPLDFGEDDAGGAIVARIGPDGSVYAEAKSVSVTKCATATVDVSDATSISAIAEQVQAEVAPLDGFVRIDITGDVSPELLIGPDELRAVIDPVMEGRFADWLIRTDRLRYRYDIESIATEESVRGAFVSDVLAEASYDEASKRQIIEIGLRAFDGRHDLEVV